MTKNTLPENFTKKKKMKKFIFLPPHSNIIYEWQTRLIDILDGWDIRVPKNRKETLNMIENADAVFGTLDDEILAHAKKLKWIQAPAAAPPAGYYFDDLINHPAIVTNFRGIYNDHISVHILALMLNLTKHINIYINQQNNKKWEPLETPKFHSTFLPESTILIVGIGGIGHETARLCKAIGMEVIGIDERIKEKPKYVDKLFSPSELDKQLKNADFVVLTIPHTPKTEGLFNLEKFKLMKESAYFINIGRGMTTKLDDLNKALRNGYIRGAGLDVYEIEPLPINHPLWNAPNIILTPHIATHGDLNIDERRFEIILENFRRFENNKNLLNVVDKSLWY